MHDSVDPDYVDHADADYVDHVDADPDYVDHVDADPDYVDHADTNRVVADLMLMLSMLMEPNSCFLGENPPLFWTQTFPFDV